MTEINDIRIYKDFKNITFSQFKKSDVKKEFLSCLKHSKLESTLYWCSEYVCSGHYVDLWDILLYFYAKYIHISNPKIIIYLDKKVIHFKNIFSNGYQKDELSMRNNIKIRLLFTEIIYILIESKKTHCFEEIKISKNELDILSISEKLKADTIDYGKIAFRSNDPKEFYIALNELTYQIRKENNVFACYWLEWLLEMDQKKNHSYKMERRIYVKENKYQLNIVWIIWELFISLSDEKHILIQKTMQSLLNLFLLKYNFTNNKKKKFLLYTAIELLTKPIDFNQDIIKEKEKMNLVLNNTDIIYQQIKKNEHKPNTDYLFHNTKNNNLNTTITRLEKMNEINNSFIPRI